MDSARSPSSAYLSTYLSQRIYSSCHWVYAEPQATFLCLAKHLDSSEEAQRDEIPLAKFHRVVPPHTLILSPAAMGKFSLTWFAISSAVRNFLSQHVFRTTTKKKCHFSKYSVLICNFGTLSLPALPLAERCLCLLTFANTHRDKKSKCETWNEDNYLTHKMLSTNNQERTDAKIETELIEVWLCASDNNKYN